MSKLIIYQDRLYQQTETPLYKGWTLVPDVSTKKDPPDFQWTGGKIPFKLWSQIVSFMRWSYQEFKSEALVNLFYNLETRQWDAWPFPQEPRGMTVEFLTKHPMYAAGRAQFGNGWIQAGTVHHHCAAGAFQSSTDRTDEEKKDGIHITVGKVDTAQVELHFRQVFDGVMGECTGPDWIEADEFVTHCPEHLQASIYFLAIRNIPLGEFPAKWKESIIKPVFPTGRPEAAPLSPNQGTLITGIRSGPHTAVNEHDRDRRDYTLEQKARLQSVLGRLGISPAMALRLLRNQDAHLRTAEDMVERMTLSRELLKEGFPPLWAETLLEKVI